MAPPNGAVAGVAGDGAPAATANGDARVGPHPGFISSSNQYSAEIKLRRMLKDNGCDPAREDTYRLQGVQLIDNVREHLQLCVSPLSGHLLPLGRLLPLILPLHPPQAGAHL